MLKPSDVHLRLWPRAKARWLHWHYGLSRKGLARAIGLNESHGHEQLNERRRRPSQSGPATLGQRRGFAVEYRRARRERRADQQPRADVRPLKGVWVRASQPPKSGKLTTSAANYRSGLMAGAQGQEAPDRLSRKPLRRRDPDGSKCLRSMAIAANLQFSKPDFRNAPKQTDRRCLRPRL